MALELSNLTLLHTFDEDLWIEEQTWASFGYVKGRKIASYVAFFLKKLRFCSTSWWFTVLLSTSKIRNAYLSFMKNSMACIVHTGHDYGECLRKHSGTTGWQVNINTRLLDKSLLGYLKIFEEQYLYLTCQYRKKKWKERIIYICKQMHISTELILSSQPFSYQGFVEQIF